MVPFGRQKLTGMVWQCSDAPFETEESFQLKEIVAVLDETPVFNAEMRELAEKLAYDNIAPVMSLVKMMLPQMSNLGKKNKPKVMEEWFVKPETLPEGKLTARQQEIFDTLYTPVLASLARKEFSSGILKTLVNKGFLLIEKRPKSFAPFAHTKQKPWPKLNFMQENALEIIRNAKQNTVLLHGVTGAGKTEVFFHLAKDALDAGKQVLILVPEISLTPMMIERVQSRFTVPVYACHSRLTGAQHLDLYKTVEKDEPCIVIGTRKSVFLPFASLGLIIMDEEHDGSYKQDSAPRYHTRDAALYRAQFHHCKLVLASATPSLDSYARAVKGVYALATLPKRAAGQDANVHILDLKSVQTTFNLSNPLLKGMQMRMNKGEKTLLLLNRRGYLPTVRCNDCKEYLVCEECNLPLSYHKQENALVCHVCGNRYPMVTNCPHCHSSSLSWTGQGTERLEEDLEAIFPTAKIVRMDADTTRRKNAHQHLLEEFEENGDILMGTQMIAKGLDYEKITLAGILSVDGILSRPDYCACEQAYQLMEQAAGRAGRGSLPGDVFIQTFNPDHYVLHFIENHDYRGFFQQEMLYRHAGHYPPYTFMASLVFLSESLDSAYAKAEQVAFVLRRKGITVLGPAEISMRRSLFRVRLLCKDDKDAHLKASLWQFARWFENNKGSTNVEINVHPMMLEA